MHRKLSTSSRSPKLTANKCEPKKRSLTFPSPIVSYPCTILSITNPVVTPLLPTRTRRYRTTEAARYLKASNWRIESALDGYFNDPRSSSGSSPSTNGGGQGSNVAGLTKNLEGLWKKYSGKSPFLLLSVSLSCVLSLLSKGVLVYSDR